MRGVWGGGVEGWWSYVGEAVAEASHPVIPDCWRGKVSFGQGASNGVGGGGGGAGSPPPPSPSPPLAERGRTPNDEYVGIWDPHGTC